MTYRSRGASFHLSSSGAMFVIPEGDTLEFDGEYAHWKDDVFAISPGLLRAAVKHGYLEAADDPS